MYATTDHLPPFWGGPGTSSFARPRDARVLAFTREQAADALAGRTVWCIAALPSGIAAAEAVEACLCRPQEERVTTGWRGVEAGAELRRLAGRIDAMLAGAVSAAAELGERERAEYAEAVADGEELLGDEVAADDVVVLHDALAAVVAEAARARGAHVVRHLHGHGPHRAGAAAARGFLGGFDRGVDAWVATGREEVVAAMPSPGHVDRKHAAERGEEAPGLCWRAVLGDVVSEDREEHVGGTIGVRPRVAAR
ncbi:hypothetical protein [Conexibacter arvalis]|uniref:Uncharacterized protein n=1 Tax=Conexibacter arvalis TaxID=912552 RepID=A0A840ID97_9ACTN|nr:hypothetical protein [Conexibacter arvalis]MBB4661910.1 hypothetical protein [Conexibacter arvalis]